MNLFVFLLSMDNALREKEDKICQSRNEKYKNIYENHTELEDREYSKTKVFSETEV